MKVSVIVPSKGCTYLGYLMRGLRDQSIKPNEVILVIKSCDLRSVENLCSKFSLSCTIIEQKEGNVTRALNMGKKEARGDITVFTDDDVIPLQKWVERYVRLHTAFRDVAGISSRDVYININNLRLLPTPDDRALYRTVKAYLYTRDFTSSLLLPFLDLLQGLCVFAGLLKAFILLVLKRYTPAK